MPHQAKEKCKKKGIVVKPLMNSEMKGRAQVNLIDVQSHSNENCRFRMVY